MSGAGDRKPRDVVCTCRPFCRRHGAWNDAARGLAKARATSRSTRPRGNRRSGGRIEDQPIRQHQGAVTPKFWYHLRYLCNGEGRRVELNVEGRTVSRLMERNRRILTSHTGSLPRPDALSALLFARMANKPYDEAELAQQIKQAVAATVKTQTELGIDIVSDGEQSKTSFQAYAAGRLAGIEPFSPPPGGRRTRENIAFPTFYRGGAHSGSARARWACTGPIEYIGQKAVAADLENLKAALQGVDPVGVFVPSV